MAAAHMARIIAQLDRQGRPTPDAVRRANEHRSKLVDISGTTAARGGHSDEQLTAQLRAIATAIESADFTNNADRGEVARMLFGLEWTMHVAIEEVLSRRGASASLTGQPSHGWRLARPLVQVHRPPGSHRRAKVAGGKDADTVGEGDSSGAAGRGGGLVGSDGVQLLP